MQEIATQKAWPNRQNRSDWETAEDSQISRTRTDLTGSKTGFSDDLEVGRGCDQRPRHALVVCYSGELLMLEVPMILGSHVSTAGGYAKAVGRAIEVGCDCVQVFSSPPGRWPVTIHPDTVQAGEQTTIEHSDESRVDRWRAKPLDEKAVVRWRQEFEASALTHPIAHGSYLINLASPKDELFRKSVDALVVELERCNQLQLEALVFHPGAYTDSSEDEGLDRIVEGASEVLARVAPGSCRLLLENTAGQGSCLGYTFKQLAHMINGIDCGQRVGICLDTCHAFAAGYEINTEAGFTEMRKEIDDLLPEHSIAALHLNDSKKPLGSRVDRHEHIGQGEIGLEAFRFVLQDPLLGSIPGYLETEKGIDEASGEQWDVINLRTLRGLC